MNIISEDKLQRVLVDARNIDQLMPEIMEAVRNASFIGIDVETHDQKAHAGIKKFRGNKTTKAFDMRRTLITGCSLFPDNHHTAYYLNILHADEENRLPLETLISILECKSESSKWVAHNACYEITTFGNPEHNYQLKDVICTLQMAVSAYGPDEFPKEKYIPFRMKNMISLFREASAVFHDFDPSDRNNLTPQQAELLSKALAKSSAAKHSYNGLVNELKYGYGLKHVVKSFFNVQMMTFEETLNGKKHMGELTGEETTYYGADDSYWAVRLFYRLLQFMAETNPDVIDTFFKQENPMVEVFADIRSKGLKVNHQAVADRTDIERANFARVLRELKNQVKELLPFPEELHDSLLRRDKWYAKEGKALEYRKRLEDWAMSPNSDDDFEQACQVSSPVSNAWAGKKVDALSIGHYYQSRLLQYDLINMKPVLAKGKVTSDADSRGVIRDRIKKKIEENMDDKHLVDRYEKADKLLQLMGELAGVEQRMKLYLTPYQLLTDPETDRMYPEVSSQLATRRMACSNPNAMQLAKRGESTYVRGFFLPDNEDHVLISIDWSQIELVLIGEFSGDPEFKKAYGQKPYQDLHLGAAADVLSVDVEGLTAEYMKSFAQNYGSLETAEELIKAGVNPRLFTAPNGDFLSPSKVVKFWRTAVGKGSNFNYWYSGALATIGEVMGWSSDKMWAATEKYRERFAVAEQWRINTIEEAMHNGGKVVLPDHHTRIRWEATPEWVNYTRNITTSYDDAGIIKFGEQIIRGVHNRSKNQIINAKIQGSCATLAKRSILSINDEIRGGGYDARFIMPIHDELLFSVHKDIAWDFITMAKHEMCYHPNIISNLAVDATASIGLTFEPFHPEKAPIGQVEIDEAPDAFGFEPDSVLNKVQVEHLISQLQYERKARLL